MKRVLRNKMNPNFYFHCCIIGCRYATMRVFDLKKNQLRTFLKHLYLNKYAELDGKIPHIVFLHDYILVCKISTKYLLKISDLNFLVRL